MASPACFLCYLLCLISSLFIFPTSSFPYTLDLSPIPKLHTYQNLKDIILDLAESSLVRASQLQQTKINSSTSTPLFPTGNLGEYTISLSIGTPPQIIPVLFDTGSSLVWVPCTSRYSCTNCTLNNNTTITTYDPYKSTSDQFTTCNSDECGWLDQPPNVMASCPNCTQGSPGSCNMRCAYIQAYGTGATTGNALFESLNLQGEIVHHFLIGCSLKSVYEPYGIAGFGRSPMSLPNQLEVTKFSYCLVSHKFDDTGKSSKLILGDSGEVEGITYTPLIKNPTILPYNQYYYVQLDEIAIGDKIIDVPSNLLVPDDIGNGGTIVDSRSTFTIMVSTVFDLIATEMEDQTPTDQLNQVALVPSSSGNILCINVTGDQTFSFPKMIFYFKGGAQMDLPVANYVNVGQDIVCLPIANSTLQIGHGGKGPAIILGNYQQQNFHIEYDLKNEMLGLKRQNCEGI